MYYWVDTKFFNEEIREFVTEAYAENNYSYMPANNAGAARWREIQKQFITEDDNMAHRICSYCGVIMGESTSIDHNGTPCDSHGACPKCAEEQLIKMRSDMAKHLKIQSFDDLQADVERRRRSGFYDSKEILSKVADEIIKDLQNAS